MADAPQREPTEADKDAGRVLITVDEVAWRLRCAPDTVLLKIKHDGLPCSRFNARLFRFHWPTVLEWTKKRR
jgi:excisionase family DNA binding protein